MRRAAEVRINLGKLRSHPCSMAYLSLENLEGLGARTDEYLFVERQADRATAVLMVLEAFPAHLSLLDAYENVPDGLAGMMGCPSPRAPRRIYASLDPIALDLVVARHVGLRDFRKNEVLRTACHWFGAPGPQIEVRGTDAEIAPWKGPYSTDVDAFLSFWANTIYSYSSGRGRLFIPEMDEQAFPPLQPVGRAQSFVRRRLQSLLGLRLPA